MAEINPLATPPSTLYPNRCLNIKHSAANCVRCSETCPVDAITVTNTAVSLNLEQCVGCGLCLHTCPAEVFETAAWSERTPIANVNTRQAESVTFFCTRHPHLGSSGQEACCIQIPTCLAAMSPGAWFELGLKRSVTLRLDWCTDCPLAEITGAILTTVDTANAWLIDAGYTARIACVTHVEASDHVSEQPVLDGSTLQLSRRGFFRMLFGTAREQFDKITAPTSITWVGQHAPNKVPHLPAWMARAAVVYTQHARPTDTQTAVWPTVSVDQTTCVVCNACTDHCPTGALLIDATSAKIYAITFNSSQCIDCRICWASCPTGAITRSQAVTSDPMQRKPISRSAITPCIHCGKPAPTGHPVCYWCEKEPPMTSLLTDARQWLFGASPDTVSEQDT